MRQSEARNTAILRAIPDWMFLTTVEGVLLDYHAKDISKLHVEPLAFLGKEHPRGAPSARCRGADAGLRARALDSDEPEKLEYAMGSDDTERFYEAASCAVTATSF